MYPVPEEKEGDGSGKPPHWCDACWQTYWRFCAMGAIAMYFFVHFESVELNRATTWQSLQQRRQQPLLKTTINVFRPPQPQQAPRVIRYGAAFVAEPRASKMRELEYALRSVDAHIPPAWPIIVAMPHDMMCTFIARHLRNNTFAAFASVTGIMSGTGGDDILQRRRVDFRNISAHFAKREYNALLTSRAFYDSFDDGGNAEHVLIFQSDSAFCGGLLPATPAERDALATFASRYDYVGAPWRFGSYRHGDTTNCGNGGFSIRRLAAMREVTSHLPPTGFGDANEDYMLCRLMREAAPRRNYSLPFGFEAQSFSVESHFYPQPLAMHKFWHFFGARQRRRVGCAGGEKLLQVHMAAAKI